MSIDVRRFAASLALLTACAHNQPRNPDKSQTRLLPPCAGTPDLALRCGRIRVPERAEESTRWIDLQVVVAPASSGKPDADAIVFLAGGPGQAATESAAGVLVELAPLRKSHDFVFVDQRGTGGSNALKCELGGRANGARAWLTGRIESDLLQRCLEHLTGDPTHYTTVDAARDLDIVRESLGYPKLDLVGVSYGTRAALVYARQYPARVRTMTLRGVYPTAARLPLYTARDADRALRRASERCAALPNCRAITPDLYGVIKNVLSALDRHPLPLPMTGDTLMLTRDVAATALMLSLYAVQPVEQFASAAVAAEAGDPNVLFGPGVLIAAQLAQSFPIGMYLSIVCSEDAAATRQEDIAVATSGTFMGPSLVTNLRQSCAAWPRATLPANYWDPVRVNTPTLVISGEEDPVTPPSWGEEVVRNLGNARHLVLAGIGHIPWMTSCARQAVAQFITTADPSVAPVRCAEESMIAAAPSAATTPSSQPQAQFELSGQWDMYWGSTTTPSGSLQLCRAGDVVKAKVRGQGELDAEGRYKSDTLSLSGRNIVTFTIIAHREDTSLRGALKVLTTERAFVARRRPEPPQCPAR